MLLYLYDLLKLNCDGTDFLFRLFINGNQFDYAIGEIPFKFMNKIIKMWTLDYYENPPLYDSELIIFKVWLEGEK